MYDVAWCLGGASVGVNWKGVIQWVFVLTPIVAKARTAQVPESISCVLITRKQCSSVESRTFIDNIDARIYCFFCGTSESCCFVEGCSRSKMVWRPKHACPKRPHICFSLSQRLCHGALLAHSRTSPLLNHQSHLNGFPRK
jgi:hypothetical protein